MLYVYRCKDEHNNDEYRRIDDRDKPMKCKVCGKKAPRVPFHVTPFSFHGLFNEGPPGSN